MRTRYAKLRSQVNTVWVSDEGRTTSDQPALRLEMIRKAVLIPQVSVELARNSRGRLANAVVFSTRLSATEANLARAAADSAVD